MVAESDVIVHPPSTDLLCQPSRDTGDVDDRRQQLKLLKPVFSPPVNPGDLVHKLSLARWQFVGQRFLVQYGMNRPLVLVGTGFFP
jgi:hypothetical protein